MLRSLAFLAQLDFKSFFVLGAFFGALLSVCLVCCSWEAVGKFRADPFQGSEIDYL